MKNTLLSQTVLHNASLYFFFFSFFSELDSDDRYDSTTNRWINKNLMFLCTFASPHDYYSIGDKNWTFGSSVHVTFRGMRVRGHHVVRHEKIPFPHKNTDSRSIRIKKYNLSAPQNANLAAAHSFRNPNHVGKTAFTPFKPDYHCLSSFVLYLWASFDKLPSSCMITCWNLRVLDILCSHEAWHPLQFVFTVP